MSSALSMAGHIDKTFTSSSVELRREVGGAFVDGIWVPGVDEVIFFGNVNIQPLNDLELQFFLRAEERIGDMRKLYINVKRIAEINLGDYLYFYDQKWKVIRRDVRMNTTYSKIIVDRFDDQ